MIYHNFRSETSNIPDLVEDIVSNAAIGTFFFGANDDIYIRKDVSDPSIVADWLKIYPNASTDSYTFSDGINDFIVENNDDVTLVTENGLYLLEASPRTFKIGSTYLSGSTNPIYPPIKPALKWFYINVTNGTYWIWNNAWVNITSGGGGIVNNGNGTYTGDGITWTGTDDQTALEIVTPTPKLGNTVLWNILNSITTNTKLPIAQFEIHDQVGLKASVSSYSSGVTLTYLWSVTPSAGVTITSNTASSTAISFPSVGKYEITLVVTDALSYTHTVKKEIIVDKTIYVNGNDSNFKLFTLLSDAYTWINTNDSANAANYTIITNGTVSTSSTITVNLAKLVLLPTTSFFSNSVIFQVLNISACYVHGYGGYNMKFMAYFYVGSNASNTTLYIDNIHSEGNNGFLLQTVTNRCYLYANNIFSSMGGQFVDTSNNGSFARLTNCRSHATSASNGFINTSHATDRFEIINCQLISLAPGAVDFIQIDHGSGYIINSQISGNKNVGTTASCVLRLDFSTSTFAWYLHNNMIEYEGDVGAVTYPGGSQHRALRLIGTHASSKAHVSNCNLVSEMLGMTVDDTNDSNITIANCFISGEDYSIYREVQATDTLASWTGAKVYNTTLHRQHTTITYATPTATITGGNVQV